jgi:hypothetical protein
MRCRFSYQIMILGVSINLLKPKSWWNRRVSTNYCTSWTNQWKNNFTANFVCKRQRDSKFRLQNKTRIPDPPEISVAKYLLRFPGSILIRLWFHSSWMKFQIRNNPVQFTQKISFWFGLQGETQEKTCGNDESALLAAGMAGKYFDSLMGSTVLVEIHNQK